MALPPSVPDPAVVTAELHRILESSAFTTARRSQRLLRYLVEHAVSDPGEHVKEYSVALDVFERDASYDPSVDATVRVEAGRLRSRLRDYYAAEGRADPLIIQIPKGGYSAVFLPTVADKPVTADAIPPSPQPASPRTYAVPLRWMLIGSFLAGGLVGYLAAL